jgi:hypothetical protein
LPAGKQGEGIGVRQKTMLNNLKNLASKLSFEYSKLSFRHFKKIDYKYYLGIIVIALVLVFGFIYLIRAPKFVEAEWWNDSWYYRRSIPVTNNIATENNVYISATIDSSDTTKFQGDCDDLRFTDEAGQELSYYLVSGCGTDTTIVHIYFSTFNNGLQNIYIYHGNSSAVAGSVDTDFSTEASDYTLGTLGSEEQSTAPIAYWSFDEGYGTIAHDNTSNQNHGTLTNMTTTGDQSAWVDGKFGKALRFDGMNDYVDTSLTENLSQNDFTVMAWIRIPNGVDTNYAVVQSHTQAGYSSDWFFPYASGSSIFWFRSITLGTYSTINDGNWHHIVMSWDESEQKYEGFVDGASIGISSTVSGYGGINSVKIGIRGDATTTRFTGSIDEVKIYNYALTPAQVKKAYNTKTKDFTGINLSLSQQDAQNRRNEGLVGFWKMDEASWSGVAGEVIDSSGNGNHGRSYNGATTTSTAKYARAGEFDGSDDYVYVPVSDDFDIDRKDFTMAGWFYLPTGAQDNWGGIMVGSSYTSGYDLTCGRFLSGSGPIVSIDFGSSVPRNEWYYLTAVHDVSQKRVVIYLNGRYLVEDIYVGDLPISNHSVYLGSDQINFEGNLDHVKIWNRALSAQEISEEYVTGPAPIGYWSMDVIDGTTVIDQSGQGNDGTMDGGMTKSNSWKPGKVGQSLKFDGNNDSVILGKPDVLQMGDGVITVSHWVKPDITNQTESAHLFYGNAGGGHRGYGTRIISDGRFSYETYGLEGGRQSYSLDIGIVDREWNHIVAIFDGVNNEMIAYLNGIEKHRVSIDDPGTVTAIYDFRIGRHGVGAWLYNGLIDEVKIYNYALTPYQIAQEYNGGAPVAYWSFDEGQGSTAYDQSENKNHGTLTNMTTSGVDSAWVDGKFGKGLRFDNSSKQYVDGGNDSVLDLSNQLTISAWVNSRETQGVNGTIISKGTINGSDYIRDQNYFLYLTDSREVRFSYGDGSNYQTVTGSVISANQWHYISVILDGSNIYLYIDGELDDSWSQTLVPITGNGDTLRIGFKSTASGSSAYGFNGDIDEVKIYNYTLTPFDIQKEYNSRAKTKTTLNLSKSEQDQKNARADGLVGWWKMDEASWSGVADEVIDSSGNGNHGTAQNGGTTTSTAKYGRAGEFDGEDDYVSKDLANSLNQVTISSWVSIDSSTGTYQVVQSLGSSPTIDIACDPGGSNCGCDFYNSVNNSVDIGYDTWTLITCTYDGTEMKQYINGEYSSTESGANKTFNTTHYIGIGRNGSSYPFKGKIDDVKIWNRALTSAEIEKEYHQGPAPIGYWSMDQINGTTVIDQSGMGNDGTLTNMTKKSNSKPGKVGQALEFDGVEEYIEMGDVDFDYGNFSVSLWVKANSQSQSHVKNLIGKGNWNSSNNWYLGYKSDLHLSFVYGTTWNTGTYYDKSNFDLTQWNHLIGVAEPDVLKLYLNGRLVHTKETEHNTVSNDFNLQIGRSSYFGNYFDGLIDEVKIYDYALTPYQIAQEYNGGAPVGYWSFDEKEGTTAHDKTENLNHGTLTNMDPATDWLSGSDCKQGGCLDFDGSDDYVLINKNRADLISGNNFTVSWWAKSNLTTSQVITTIFGHWYIMHASNDNKGRYFINGLDSSPFDSNVAINDGKWHYFNLSYDGSYVKLYVDGQLDINTLASGDLSATYNLYIGQRDNGTYNFNGQVDEFKIWNYALTPLQVQQDYNLGKSLYFK